jgi:hypothetical protein
VERKGRFAVTNVTVTSPVIVPRKFTVGDGLGLQNLSLNNSDELVKLSSRTGLTTMQLSNAHTGLVDLVRVVFGDGEWDEAKIKKVKESVLSLFE